MLYHSISASLPDSIREFGEIWRIIEIHGRIYFQSFTHIFRLSSGIVEIVYQHPRIQYLCLVGDKLYLNIEGEGLGRLTRDNEFRKLNHGSFFSDKLVKTCFLIDGILHVGTERAGIFRMSNKAVFWNSEVSRLVYASQLYSGLKLSDEYLAFGTISSGLLITDKEGNIIQNLNIDKGIQNNSVLSVFADKKGDLWLGLDNGIDYIFITSPLSYLNPKAKLGACYYSYEKEGMLYLGTNQGLYTTDWTMLRSNKQEPNIRAFRNILPGQVWKIQEFRDNLIVGHNDGTYLVNNNKTEKICDIDGGWQYHIWPGDSTKMIASTFTGLVLFSFREDRWRFDKHYADFDESCPEFEIDHNNNLWLCHRHRGVFRIRLAADLGSLETITFYDTTFGLPSNYMNSLFRLDEKIYISNGTSILEFNEVSNRFEKNEELTLLFGQRKISKVYRDPVSNYWYFHEKGISLLRSNFDGTYDNYDLPYFDAGRLFLPNFEHLLMIGNNDIIISARDGYIHFNPSLSANVNREFSVYLRSVKSASNTLYSGNESCFDPDKLLQIPFRNNTIGVRMGNDYFRNLPAVRYQYWLEGWESGWNTWSPEQNINYSNLHEGLYTLHVRGSNEFKHITKESKFTFEIEPPWYRSILAYLSYILISVFILLTVFRLVLRKIEREKEILRKKQIAEMAKKQEQYEQETLITEQEIVKLRNEMLNIENDRNRAELENKSKELAAIIMQANYKNEIFDRIKHILTKITHNMVHRESKQEVEKVISTIENELDQKEDWNRFEVHFDQVHEDFIQRLRKQYPDLSPKDLKLAAYLRMNLATKEIAPLLNLSMRGIETGRYRLRKKLGLGRSDNLTDVLLNI